MNSNQRLVLEIYRQNITMSLTVERKRSRLLLHDCLSKPTLDFHVWAQSRLSLCEKCCMSFLTSVFLTCLTFFRMFCKGFCILESQRVYFWPSLLAGCYVLHCMLELYLQKWLKMKLEKLLMCALISEQTCTICLRDINDCLFFKE